MKKVFAALLCVVGFRSFAEPVSFSGIYPSLAFFNNEGECGTGAVVPWAGKLWVITYGPHLPKGSSDKLYEIDCALNETIRPESIGGTPANRMIHRESQQLFIGPYAIDEKGGVRAIPYSQMFGRLTDNARHLTDPENKIYCATMEEGIYEVDVHSLVVTELWRDQQLKDGRHSGIPGYHGKGLYSGQGVLIYANNGEHGAKAESDPDAESGCLAEWDGKADHWTIVRRNQFTEITGPGGIFGSANPATNPIWTIGWDYRSLILGLRENGGWHFFRLPKASHTYDGAHGWHTEWPRIRDVGAEGKPDLLMTMHGMFWRFPKTFSLANTAGIRPRSSFLKITGDFCRWNDKLVVGCDDSAKSEFTNTRKMFKGGIKPAGQSQSNLWFVDPDAPDHLGPTTSEGAVWLRDAVKAGDVSDPFLFSGWENRGAHFINGGDAPVTFELEADEKGDGAWKKLRDVKLGAHESSWSVFTASEVGEWIRVKAVDDCPAATVHFAYSAKEIRDAMPDAMFDGLAKIGDAKYSGGLLHARGENKRTLSVAAMNVENGTASDAGYYELTADAKLVKVDDEKAREYTKTSAAIPKNAITVDGASILMIDEKGNRWRLPKGDPKFDVATSSGLLRIEREVSTERDLFDCCGTFYELPAVTSGSFAKIRPISSHNFAVMDYCSYRGLLVLSGIANVDAKNPHIVRSDDGKAAVWCGAFDDLWKIGKPTGHGGPWKWSDVKAGVPSDPYLFGFYDKRSLTLRHDQKEPVTFTIEVDPAGMGTWVTYQKISVKPGTAESMTFPSGLSARWIRVTASSDCKADALLTFE